MLKKERDGWVFYIKRSDLIGPTGPPGPAANTNNIVNGSSNINNGIRVHINGENNHNEGDNVHISGKNNDNTVDDVIINGENNINKGRGSIICGHNHINSGRSSVLLGGGHNSNNAIYSGFIAGHHNELSGPNSVIIGGTYNTINSDSSVILGGHSLISDADNSVTLGRYNSPESDALLCIGNGSSVSKNNAFIVNELGEVKSNQFISPMRSVGFRLPGVSYLTIGDTVVIDNGLLRLCLDNEVPIGVISDNVGIICNYQPSLVLDKDGSPIYEEIEEDIHVPDIIEIETESKILIEKDGYYQLESRPIKQKVIRTELLPIKNENGEIIGNHPKMCYKTKRVKYHKPQVDENYSEENNIYTVAILGISYIKSDQITAPRWTNIIDNTWLLF